MRINSVSDFRKAMRVGPYAFPGGYPTYFIMKDGSTVSYQAAKKIVPRKLSKNNIREMLVDIPIALEINWEDNELYCEMTNERIPSAYGCLPSEASYGGE